ncbi:D-2-hydroxyacid dehydrogenase family protein [Pelagibius sp. Alg239-R121]|uniref:D-2-hydroxyacid dehydrogenase family protein n=1 Tax=Pelagibius sp. Alg239-R121 TaxID=2993448 RepID=UPI0024A76A6F|nr:D-2-hydroxyacid dehydrogenase family protein [Pelagibius sp. Alg239-R121]
MKIAILDDYQSLARSFADWNRLRDRASVQFFTDPISDPAQLTDCLGSFDVICLMRERTAFTGDLIKALPNLKLLVTSGMKNGAIDLPAAEERGIVVSGTSSPGHATAELTFGLILALARNLLPQSNSLQAGRWQTGIGRDLRGATLGLLGLGRLGSQVAAFGRAFGMKVIAWSENLSTERCAEVGVDYREKTQLFAESDFLSVHLRLSKRTEGLIGANELFLMKPDAYLVNTSRAAIIEMAALERALVGGVIAGAALDVFDHEPLPPDHPLLSTPNLLLTPHIGYVTRETYEIFYREMLEAIEAWLDGQPIRVLAS